MKPSDFPDREANIGERLIRYPVRIWSELRAHATSWSIALFGLVAAQTLTVFTLVIVARHVSPLEYGQYLACYALVTLLVVVPSYGLDTLLLAEGGRSKVQGVSLWHQALRLRVGLLSLWTLVIIALAFMLPSDRFPPGILLSTAVGAACDSLVMLSYSALRSEAQHKRVSLLQLTVAVLTLTITLLLPLAPGCIILFSLARAAVSTASAAGVVILTRYSLKISPSRFPLSVLMHAARPFVVADIAVATYLKADLTLVTLFLGAAGASLYGPALNIVNISFLVPNALYLVVLPVLAHSYEAMPHIFAHTGRAQLAAQASAGAAMSLMILALAQPVVYVTLGPGYDGSVFVLRLLSLVPFLKSINFGLAALLTAGKLQAWRTRAQLVCAIFNVLADVAVIPRWGVSGVAIVYTCSELLLLAEYSFVVCRRDILRQRHGRLLSA